MSRAQSSAGDPPTAALNEADAPAKARTPRRGGRPEGERASRPKPRTKPRAEVADRPHVAIITGLSGAGKTATSKLFEDLGYSVVDNLPAELLPQLAELVGTDRERFQRVAIVIDVRQGNAPVAFDAVVAALHTRGIEPQVFFLQARDDVLIRRYSETRHRHPLQGERGIGAAIEEERQLLKEVRDEADVVIDTSELSGRQLKERIFAALEQHAQADRIALQLISFGYKHGVPLEADLVFDVRFMENPFYRRELRPLSGLTEPVRTFVLAQPAAQRFLRFTEEFFDFAIPAYIAEGKTRLTIAVGCTGGFHRSITLTEVMAEKLRAREYGPVSLWHRDMPEATIP